MWWIKTQSLIILQEKVFKIFSELRQAPLLIKNGCIKNILSTYYLPLCEHQGNQGKKTYLSRRGSSICPRSQRCCATKRLYEISTMKCMQRSHLMICKSRNMNYNNKMKHALNCMHLMSHQRDMRLVNIGNRFFWWSSKHQE